MKIKFRDLYDTLKQTRQSVTDMGLDADNVLNGEPSCVLSSEVDRLRSSYMSLYNADVIVGFDIHHIRFEINRCVSCINL